MTHLVPIPSFDGQGFEAYERDVSLWRNATDVPKEKQALVLMLRLTGRAATLAKAEPLAAYATDSGVGNLLAFLRKKFGQSPIYLIHQDLKAFFGIRRTEASVTEFLGRFQMSRSQVENRLGKPLDEEVACSILLEASALNPQDKRNALAAVSDFRDSAKLLSAIQHLFSSDRNKDGSVLVADHVLPASQHHEETPVFRLLLLQTRIYSRRPLRTRLEFRRRLRCTTRCAIA